jgi:hypothetical protein
MLFRHLFWMQCNTLRYEVTWIRIYSTTDSTYTTLYEIAAYYEEVLATKYKCFRIDLIKITMLKLKM